MVGLLRGTPSPHDEWSKKKRHSNDRLAHLTDRMMRQCFTSNAIHALFVGRVDGSSTSSVRLLASAGRDSLGTSHYPLHTPLALARVLSPKILRADSLGTPGTVKWFL